MSSLWAQKKIRNWKMSYSQVSLGYKNYLWNFSQSHMQMQFSAGLSHSLYPSCLLLFHLVLSTCFGNLNQIPSYWNQNFWSFQHGKKMGNIKKTRKYCFAQRNNSNVQNSTPEESSNGFTMYFKSKPQIPNSV